MFNIKNLKNMAQDLSVLYVEDDAAIQKSMKSYLQKFFSFVETASDGEEGLQVYKKREFDIVITDISMPKMNGLEMIEEIQKQNKEQLFLITTAHYEPDYMFSAIKDGVDGYILTDVTII